MPMSPSRSTEGNDLNKSEEALATERAWSVDYAGEAAHALLDHMKDFLPNAKHNRPFRCLYARYTAVIQSSGMGKSRAVDEIAKSELVIPIVLRPHGSTGYPPADSNAQAYLMGFSPGMSQRVFSFLQALFEEVSSVVESKDAPLEGLAPFDRSKPLANQFRAYMNHGMGMSGHGQFRVEFYDRVVRKAYEIKQNSVSPKDLSFSLNASCTKLLKAMQAFHHDPSQASFVILSFDEIHVLGDHFIRFRPALHALEGQPVLSILLSTAGHMYKSLPNSLASESADPSARLLGEGPVIPPFSELGLDHFAKDIHLPSTGDAMSINIKLSHVSSTAQLVKFGRPLWATRYDEGITTIRTVIILFAASKLLGGIDPSYVEHLDASQQLGCLAQRLPIEFRSVSYSSNLTDPQAVQVRSHLRVLARVDDNFETMITTSPSEPILSEAAYWMMYSELFKPAEALKNILDGFSVDHGDRGELLLMLLLTLARDAAVGPADEFGVPQSGNRWCSVTGFLSNLFVQSPWEAALGHRKSSMEELLGDSKVYFNHFVKVHELEMMNVKYIMRLMARGAAIFCAAPQQGVDLLIPFILDGDVLAEGNIGVILIQVTNDHMFGDNPQPEFFKSMSVEGLAPQIPILRFFFALAAKRHAITAVDTPPQASNTFDFWVAGLSSEILEPVRDEGDKIWSELLDASYGWDEIYSESGRGEKRDRMVNLRRSMYPGGAVDDAHWNPWWE